MTVATLIAILQGCKQEAEIKFQNMEIDKLEEVVKVTEHDRGSIFPEWSRYYVKLS